MKRVLGLALAGIAAVTFGYQLDRPLTLRLGSGVFDVWATRGLYGAEPGFRWTDEVGSIVVPGPGPGRRMRVEVDLQAWRPRGEKAPRAWIEAGGARVPAQTTTERQTVALEATTSGGWSSDLEVRVRSELWSPGGGDARRLGVRVHEVRAVPLAPRGGPRAVPLRHLLLAALLVPLIGALVRRTGASERRGLALAILAAIATGLAFAGWRAHAAVLILPLLAAATLLEALLRLAPGPCRTTARVVEEAARAFASGLRRLWAWPAIALGAAAVLAVVGAYRARPLLQIDPDSRAAGAVLRSFGPPEGDDPLRYRPLPRGAYVDLRDFGSGSSWRVRASLSAARALPRPMALLRLGPREASGLADPAWTTVDLDADSPLGLRSGPLVEFPAAALPVDLRLHSLEVDRGRSLPSPFALACVLGASFLLAGAAAVTGVGSLVVWSTAALTGGALALALGKEPLATIPFLPAALGLAGAAAVLSALATAVARLARSRGALVPPPAALAAAALAFAAFWATTAYPLYRGGHFVFHSSVAEEIWRGRFLLFYLPYPGSVLSRQPQWANLIVPHPCLYHTLVSPLAVLPHAWFYFLEKGFLALLLAGSVLVAALLGARARGERSAVFAAVLAASIPSSYQLLGLGHLMTILGASSFALAFGFLILRFDALPQRRALLAAAALLTLCFLSYFAGLIFAFVALCLVVVTLRAREPRSVRALLLATTLAAGAAFALYYVHWTGPFLRQTVPVLLSRAAGSAGGEATAASIPLARRLARVPEQLEYTFGSAVVPLVGLLALGLAPRTSSRVLLFAWGGILVLFTVFDQRFNFLLKHHYFTVVPVAVGGGLLLGALSDRGRHGRALSALALLAVVLLGAQRAFEAATGRIP